MIKFTYCFLILNIYIGGLIAQNDTTIPLPERVIHGKLKNGMTYYVMPNQAIKNRASLFLVNNVGAILEEDHENGLTHFLEHMAFNGSKNFPGKAMINYLESYGLKQGRELNAYTTKDETVFHISNLPTLNKNLVDSALLILNDLACNLLLKANEIDAERGVVLEEWRTRNNASTRVRNEKNKVYTNFSKYAERDVIGDMSVIENFKYETLRKFYKKWYQPQNQAVIVVGDFNAKAIAKKVETIFSKIPKAKKSTSRPYFKVEDSEQLQFVLAKDKETKGVITEWIFRRPITRNKDEEYMKMDITRTLFFNIFNRRMQEIFFDPRCPAMSYKVGKYDLSRTETSTYLSIIPKPGMSMNAFGQMAFELHRFKQHGVLKSELQEAKQQLLESYQNNHLNHVAISNDAWCGAFQNHFLKGLPAASAKWDYEFAKKTLPSITVNDINALSNDFSNIENSVIGMSCPEVAGLRYPDKNLFLSIHKKMLSVEVAPFKYAEKANQLIDKKLSEKEVISEQKVEGCNATSYTLENGAKVVLLPAQGKDILFKAFSFGGTSKVATPELACADVAAMMVELSGLGKYNSAQLQKQLLGKSTSLNASLGYYKEGFAGKTTANELNTLLELIYLYFEEPRFDLAMFDRECKAWNKILPAHHANADKAFLDTIKMVSNNYHPRTLLLNNDYVKSVTARKTKKIYLDRFQDASDFTFIFVGNINAQNALPLIRKYIGNISSSNRHEEYVKHDARLAKGNTYREFKRKMKVPKSSIYMGFFKDIKYSTDATLYTSIIKDLLQKRYLKTIREEEGATYSIDMQQLVAKVPVQQAYITVAFTCRPGNEASLANIVKSEITKISTELCSEKDLDEIKTNYIKEIVEREDRSEYLINQLETSFINQEKFVTTADYLQIIKEIDRAKILKYAKEFFSDIDSIHVVMKPE